MREDANNRLSPAHKRNRDMEKPDKRKAVISEIIAAIADIIVSIFDFFD